MGVSLHPDDALCAARAVVADLSDDALQSLGEPEAAAEDLRTNGLDTVARLLSDSAEEDLFDCIGPAHMLELMLNGSENPIRVSVTSETCLRNLADSDETFRTTFLDLSALPPTWTLQTERCLTQGGDSAVIQALFGDDLPSDAPAFVFEAGGPKAWWPGGTLVGCGEVGFTSDGDISDEAGTVRVDLVDLVALERTLLGPSEEYACARATLSPDGTQLAYESGSDAVIVVADLDGGSRKQLDTGTVSDPASPDWSPNGQWIAFGSADGGDIYVVHPDGTGLTRVGTGEAPQWSPDSASLLVKSTDEDSIERIDIATRTQRTLIAGARSAAWSPDGRWIAYVRDDLVGLWSSTNGDAGELDALAGLTVSETFAPTWSPDSRWILVDSDDHGALIVNPQTNTVHRLAETGTDSETDITWEAAGKD